MKARVRTRRAANAAAGSALVALALAIRGVLGAVLAVGGAALLVQGATGKSLGETIRDALRKNRISEDARVDRASQQSFPASDPPSYSSKS